MSIFFISQFFLCFCRQIRYNKENASIAAETYFPDGERCQHEHGFSSQLSARWQLTRLPAVWRTPRMGRRDTQSPLLCLCSLCSKMSPSLVHLTAGSPGRCSGSTAGFGPSPLPNRRKVRCINTKSPQRTGSSWTAPTRLPLAASCARVLPRSSAFWRDTAGRTRLIWRSGRKTITAP